MPVGRKSRSTQRDSSVFACCAAGTYATPRLDESGRAWRRRTVGFDASWPMMSEANASKFIDLPAFKLHNNDASNY